MRKTFLCFFFCRYIKLNGRELVFVITQEFSELVTGAAAAAAAAARRPVSDAAAKDDVL